jgi:hypothetical protein
MATTENTENTTTTEAPVKRTRKPAAKRTPAKATTRKPAAKKAAPKKATSGNGRKVRWVVGQVFPNGKAQAGIGLGGTQYAISRSGNGEFTATVKTDKGTTELGKGSFSAAYWACVNHNKTAVDKATTAAQKRAAKKVA